MAPIQATLALCAAVASLFTPSQAFTASNASRLVSRRLADVTCTIEKDVDIKGNDIGNTPGASAQECCAKCGGTAGCGAFSWSSFNGGTCWFKSGKGTTVATSGVYSAVVAASSSGSCTIESGVDYVDNDIGSVAGASAQDCCSKCSSTSGCGAFSWNNFNGGTCWLKSGKGQTTTKSGVFSGTITASSTTCATVEQDVDYVGNDIGSVLASASQSCCSICSKQAGCGAFSWSNFNGGTCWLKSSRGQTVKKAGVSSGTVSLASQCPTIENSVDYIGNDIGSVLATAATDCCAKCTQTSGCGAFSWTNFNGGTCWLKSGKGQSTTKAGVYSAAYTSSPSPSPSTHIQARIRSGEVRAISVNLGGWLVGEYWMSYTSPAWTGVGENGWKGEYGTMQFLGREKGTAQFEQHRATWITESDIQAIAAAGMNTVRVPVGFWIVNDDSSTTANDITRVYAPGALKYLDRLINEWAVKHNLAVMLSLHAHQGSQNGYDHSAPQVLSTTSWSTSQANVDNSLQFATFLAARYKDSVAFLGMNLMNEPSYPTDYTVLLGYYKEAYRRIRATGNNCVLGVSPMLQEQGPPTMMDFMRWPDYVNVWHEFHVYYKWGYEGQNEQSILNAAKTYRGSHLDNWSGNWVFMGEWSLASPDSAPFSDRNQLKQLAAIQLEQFKGAHSGWSFWAWRHDDETKMLSQWSMRQLLQEGIFTVPAP